jgi:protease-4
MDRQISGEIMRKFFGTVFIVLIVIMVIAVASAISGLVGLVNPESVHLSKASILHLELDGVIIDGKEVLEFIREYSRDEEIKGVLLEINSPGGVVGPSQEIYAELKRIREELKKPVVVTCGSLAASGAYYAAVAADKIYVNPGSMLGSIGVIMEFPYLEKLYEWAKVDFYTIKTGAFKDSGSPGRVMTEDERALFQELLKEVYVQFKTAVMEGRKLDRDVVDKYADGRVFNGATAVKLGFADHIGTFEDARREVGEMAGLGKNPDLFKPRRQPESFFEYLQGVEGRANPVDQIAAKFKRVQLAGRPLLLMPYSFF